MIEIRTVNGKLDEIVCKQGFVHLEQLSDHTWWLSIETPDGRRVDTTLFTSRATIKANFEADRKIKIVDSGGA